MRAGIGVSHATRVAVPVEKVGSELPENVMELLSGVS